MSAKTTLPTPGTTYVPTHPGRRSKPRTVAWAGQAPRSLSYTPSYTTVGWRHARDASAASWPDSGHDSWLGLEAWLAWVRKHAAVVVDDRGDA